MRLSALLGFVFVLVIALFLLFWFQGERDGDEQQNVTPRLNICLLNHSWGTEAAVEIDPYGTDGWSWDNADFRPTVFWFSSHTSHSGGRGISGGSGIAMKGELDRSYHNISSALTCGSCLYGYYAAVTNGSSWVVASILERWNDPVPGVNRSLNFSLSATEDGFVVSVRANEGRLPNITGISFEAKILGHHAEHHGGGFRTRELCYDATTIWTRPMPVAPFDGNTAPEDLDVKAMYLCAASGDDHVLYLGDIGWRDCGEAPKVLLHDRGQEP